MKRSTIDKISFVPATFWCLHVGAIDLLETLHRELKLYFESKNLNSILATPANLDSVRHRLFYKPTVLEWLTHNSDLTPNKAATTIKEFPIPVARQMYENARNPMQFLGLAAAISKNPDIVIYETSGMDPRGISLIHEYAQVQYPNGCLIHVSPHCAGYVPTCPKTAQCVTVQFDSPIGNT